VSTNREIAERYAATLADAILGGPYDALDALRHPDFVEEWPQSGERIRGGTNMRAIDSHRANKPAEGSIAQFIGSEDRFALSPMMTVVHVAGTGDTYTIVWRATYQAGDNWYVVMLCTLRDRRVWRATTYFAPLYEAPEWRSEWVERMEPAG
jgi:hypothetical protein